jgi:hypothetical protein
MIHLLIIVSQAAGVALAEANRRRIEQGLPTIPFEPEPPPTWRDRVKDAFVWLIVGLLRAIPTILIGLILYVTVKIAMALQGFQFP